MRGRDEVRGEECHLVPHSSVAASVAAAGAAVRSYAVVSEATVEQLAVDLQHGPDAA